MQSGQIDESPNLIMPWPVVTMVREYGTVNALYTKFHIWGGG